MWFSAILLLASSLVLSSGNILHGTIDVARLQLILQENIKSKDISSLYYAVKGLKQLKANIPNICEDIKNANYDSNNVEQIFYLTNAASLSGCLNSLKPEVLNTPIQTLDKKDATLAEIYYAVYSLKALGKGSIYDKDSGLKNLIQLLKKDDSPANYGYVFGLCEHMGCTAWTASHAEGVLLAADESDSKALHLEGGLPVTSLLLTTIYRSYRSLKMASPLTEPQRYKFAQYLLSRRTVSTAKGAALLLDAASVIADDQPTPISITVKGKKYVTADSESIEFSVTDLLGQAVRGLKPEEVIAQSATRLADDVVVLSKQSLTQNPKDPRTFSLNLSKIKGQYGLYKIALSAGTKTTNINIPVLGELLVNSIEIGVGDVDGTTSPKLTTVTYPNKLTDKLQADHLQKVTLKWTIRDKANKPTLVQQAFVRVATEQHEAIFVAEPDNAKAYKVELNGGSIGKHLEQISGAYSISIFVGDSGASSPVAWTIGDVTFNLAENGVAGAGGAGGAGAGEVWARGPRPQIAHEFRAPEPRPPRLVSDVAAAAAAAPLLLLLVLWARIGINFANFPITLSALLFHVSLGGLFSLYGFLWLKLSMFEIVRYLLPLAALAFLSGHRLLRRLVKDKQTSIKD